MTATIDHSQHDHPATKDAREKCRRELARYPEPEREGSVFRQDDGTLWQRLVLAPDSVNRGDSIAGFDVVGTSTDARHDNSPAVRLELVQGPLTGRLVVQRDAEVMVYRKFDPEKQDMTVDLDIEIADPESVLREVFDLVSQTMVIPKLLTMAGPGGYPIVRFTGPKKDLVTVLKRYTPGGWEDLLLELQPVHETVDQVQEFKYNLLPWQRDRIETMLGAHNSKRWVPTRLLLAAEDKPRRTIFNQEVRDGWALRPHGDPDWTRYVGRELMAALIEHYPHLLDVPEDFLP